MKNLKSMVEIGSFFILTKKDHKPSIDTIETYMNAFIHLAQDLGKDEDDYRLSNIFL